MKQIIDLRPCPVRIRDSADEAPFWEEVARLRRTLQCQYFVCPRWSITAPNGKRFEGGQPIKPSDLDGGGRYPGAAFREALRNGEVMETSHRAEPGPPDAA